jgi:predicted Zn-dependent protease
LKRRSSLYLKLGEIKPEEIISGIDRGLYLTWFQSVGSPTFSVRSIKIGGSGK